MRKRISFLLVVCMVLALLAPPAFAAGETIAVSGAGLASPATLNVDDLKSSGSLISELYSTVNTFPTPKIIAYKGVSLASLLEKAGYKGGATLIKISSGDGFAQTFTMAELIDAERYYFEGVMSGESGKKAARVPIIAFQSGKDLSSLADCEPTLVFGQRAVSEQTNISFVKYVAKIELLNDKVEQTPRVTATPASGGLAAGQGVTLSCADGKAKIYYTLDGKDPTLDSPMFNISAPGYQPELNAPIKLSAGGTIKAFAVSPGKANSEISTFAYTVGGAKFSDLAGYDWAEDAIYELVGRGIINGMGGDTFAPAGSLTRAQFAKMIVLAVDGKEPQAAASSSFSDIKKGAWYIHYAERASKLGLVTGYPDGTFGPERPVTLEEMFTVLVRVAGYETESKKLTGGGLGLLGYGEGSKISGWALGHIEMAADLELIEQGHVALQSGKTNPLTGRLYMTIDSTRAANRAQAAESVMRTLKLIEKRAADEKSAA